MNSSQTISKIAPALLAAQKEMGNAKKDSKNPFFKSKFADLNSVREAVTPALHSNGIIVLQPTVYDSGRNFVQTLLLHESGEYISSDTEIICAKINDPQAYGSAVSYARRYGLSSMLSVGAEDNDAEGAVDRNARSSVNVDNTVAIAIAAKVSTTPVQSKPTFRKPTKASAPTPTPPVETESKSSDDLDKWI